MCITLFLGIQLDYYLCSGESLHLLLVVYFPFVCQHCSFFFVCGSLCKDNFKATRATLHEFVYLKKQGNIKMMKPEKIIIKIKRYENILAEQCLVILI